MKCFPGRFVVPIRRAVSIDLERRLIAPNSLALSHFLNDRRISTP
jgi:hypothetical protein